MNGIYLAVLATRMAASRGDQVGNGDSLFPNQPRPRPRSPFPWDVFFRLFPGDAVRNQPRLRPWAPLGRRWPQVFVMDVVRWARALAGLGPAELSSADPALDYKAFVARALPATGDHRLQGTRLPMGERARVVHKAARLLKRHVAAGTLLCGTPPRRCHSLLPFGRTRVCWPIGSPRLRS